MNDKLDGWNVFSRGLFVVVSVFVVFPASALNTSDHTPITCKITVKKLIKYRGSFYVNFCFSCHLKNSTFNVCLSIFFSIYFYSLEANYFTIL